MSIPEGKTYIVLRGRWTGHTFFSTDEHLDRWLRHMKLTRDDVREAIGGVLARADYPALYEMIGTAFGAGDGDGETFSLPDMRGKVL